MKKTSILLILCLLSFGTFKLESKDSHKTKKATPSLKKEKWVANKILVRINGINILQSVLDEPQLAKDGKNFSLQEAINEELLFQKASAKQLLPSNLDVQRQIVGLKMQNNMANISDEDFEKELKQSGFTMPMYKKQIYRHMAIENIKRLETEERVIVTTQEVKSFYKKNPEHDKEAYDLKKVTFSSKEKNNYKKLLKKGVLKWQDLGWEDKDNIDPRFSFISSMKEDETSEPTEIKEDTFIVFKLVDRKERKLKTLADSYASIERIIHNKKRETFLVDALKELTSKATIAYL